MARKRIINRTYACRFCGRLRRAPAVYVAGAPPVPRCCGHAMQGLTYEQTVAATQLGGAERADWIAAGGAVARRGGKRPWRAVRNQS
jgi:hypothetical protein